MDKEKNKLPLYELIVEDEFEDTGVYGVSLVTDPAIEVNWMVFNELEAEGRYKFSTDGDEHLITGPAMLPNIPIIRYDQWNDSYYNVFFSEKSVKNSMVSFMKEGKTKESNVNHENEFFNGLTIVESWIVEDPTNDKSNALGYKDIPVGSWFTSFKIEDESVWNKIKSGEIKGFSIEGLFIEEAVQMSKEFNKDSNRLTDSEVEFMYNSVNAVLESNIDGEQKFNLIEKMLNKNRKK